MLRRLRNPILLTVALLFLAAPCSAANKLNISSLGMRAELLKLHNQKRKAGGKKPLKLNPQLSKAAQAYAEFLAKSGKFSHTAKGTMGSRVKDAGYKPKAVGENIAVGQRSPSSVVKSWMGSEGHKKNILNKKFTEVGFGVAKDKRGRTLWVTDFGDR